MAEGLTNRDISRQLNLSEHTVRNYLFRSSTKWTSNRFELALYALNRREEHSQGNVALPDPRVVDGYEDSALASLWT